MHTIKVSTGKRIGPARRFLGAARYAGRRRIELAAGHFRSADRAGACLGQSFATYIKAMLVYSCRQSFSFGPALLSVLLLAGCAAPGTPTKRVASVIELRPEKEALYRRLHAEPTPEVLAVMREANLRNFSIYLREIDGRKLLFAYFEHHGRDFKGDMAKLGASPVTKDWHKLTDPCQRPVPGAARGESWSGLEEVFHMP